MIFNNFGKIWGGALFLAELKELTGCHCRESTPCKLCTHVPTICAGWPCGEFKPCEPSQPCKPFQLSNETYLRLPLTVVGGGDISKIGPPQISLENQ